MSKIYVVTIQDTSPSEFFVKADSKVAAKRHVVDSRMIVRLATMEELYEAGQAGIEIESSTPAIDPTYGASEEIQ